MTETTKDVRTIYWEGGLDGACRLIEQTKLPGTLEEIVCQTPEQMWDAIKRLAVRGAPAIGVAAGFGTVLGIRNSTASDAAGFLADLKQTTDYLATSRPTRSKLLFIRRMHRR